MKKHFFSIIKIIISFSLIALIFYLFRDKLDEVVDLIKGANGYVLTGAFIGVFFLSFLFALRLKLVLSVQGVDVSVFNAFVVVMFGYFCNNFVPSSVGSDVIKGVYLSRETNKVKEVFSSILVDRIIGLATLISIGIVATLINKDLMGDAKVLKMIVVMVIFAVLLCFFFLNKSLARFLKPFVLFLPSKKIREKLKEFYFAIHGYKGHPRIISIVIMISVAVQLFLFSMLYLLAYAIHADISILMFFSLMPIISMAVVAPSLNGLGVREVLFVYFFGRYCGPEGALAISLLIDALFVFLGIVGGVIFSFAGSMKLKDLQEVEAS